MKEKITAFIKRTAMIFGNMSMKKRITVIAVIAFLAVGACAGVYALVPKNETASQITNSSSSHIKDRDEDKQGKEKEEKEEKGKNEVPKESVQPSTNTSTQQPAAAAVNSGNVNNKTAYDESSKQVQDAAKKAESSSSIASKAASQGGTDVISYEMQNEAHLQEYMNEEVPEEEQRIVATSASICDIMDRLGINLVGVPETTVSAIPSRYDGVTRVGSPMAPDLEIIRTLNPTDVIGPDTLQADLQMQYDNMGISSTFLNLRSVEGLYEGVKALGHKYGKSAEADAIVQEYYDFMNSYSNGHEGEASPRVLVLMGLPGSYLVATQNSYAGSLVELAGGTNVFHDDSKDFISVNTEAIYQSKPDVIIRTAHGLPKEALEMFEKEFSTNDIWKHFKAVQEGRVYDVDYMLFGMSASFDYPQALAELEPMLYN